MVTQPPIEGNLDCQARPFHSELCFDRETFKHQSELRDSFHLLQKYHLEHLMTPRDFFYPQVALYFYQSMTTHCVLDPTFIHFTIDGRHGILGARHIAEALHILYEPVSLTNYKEWLIFLRATWSVYCPGGHPHARLFLGRSFRPACFFWMCSYAPTYFHFRRWCKGDELY